MKLLLLPAFFLVLSLSNPLRAQDENAALFYHDGEINLNWHAATGRTYFVQRSTNLRDWFYFDEIFSRDNAPVSLGLYSNAPQLFFRLQHTDLDDGGDPEKADFDGDGLSSYSEITSAVQTDPLNPDTDGDMLLDGFERQHGFDPRNADSNGNGIIDGLDDWDGDGSNNFGEQLNGGNPNDNQDGGQGPLPGNPPATDPNDIDSDGDGIADSMDADPEEALIDWERASLGGYALIKIESGLSSPQLLTDDYQILFADNKIWKSGEIEEIDFPMGSWQVKFTNEGETETDTLVWGSFGGQVAGLNPSGSILMNSGYAPTTYPFGSGILSWGHGMVALDGERIAPDFSSFDWQIPDKSARGHYLFNDGRFVGSYQSYEANFDDLVIYQPNGGKRELPNSGDHSFASGAPDGLVVAKGPFPTDVWSYWDARETNGIASSNEKKSIPQRGIYSNFGSIHTLPNGKVGIAGVSSASQANFQPMILVEDPQGTLVEIPAMSTAGFSQWTGAGTALGFQNEERKLWINGETHSLREFCPSLDEILTENNLDDYSYRIVDTNSSGGILIAVPEINSTLILLPLAIKATSNGFPPTGLAGKYRSAPEKSSVDNLISVWPTEELKITIELPEPFKSNPPVGLINWNVTGYTVPRQTSEFTFNWLNTGFKRITINVGRSAFNVVVDVPDVGNISQGDALLALDPITAASVVAFGLNAINYTNDPANFPSVVPKKDAIRHSYWTALCASDILVDNQGVLFVTTAHERNNKWGVSTFGSFRRSQQAFNSTMDLHNNLVGLATAHMTMIGTPDRSAILQDLNQKYQQGLMWIYDGNTSEAASEGILSKSNQQKIFLP